MTVPVKRQWAAQPLYLNLIEQNLGNGVAWEYPQHECPSEKSAEVSHDYIIIMSVSNINPCVKYRLSWRPVAATWNNRHCFNTSIE